MKNSVQVSKKVKKLYKQQDIEISPILDGLLLECDRIQNIQDRLWKLTTTGPLITEYTNKAGACNLVPSAALKELRSWELVFQGACRSVFKILRNDLENIEDNDGDLDEYI